MMDISTVNFPGKISYRDQLSLNSGASQDQTISTSNSNSAIKAEIVGNGLFEKKPELPKTLMNLDEMKNFLFMLIGSDLMLEPDTKSIGEQINKLA